MTSIQSTADDIIQSLITMDNVDEAQLISDALDSLPERQRDKCLEYIKENHNLLTEDEAQLKYRPEEV